ncbi:MAG: DUF4198 domain-containing protein [Proteobacteria bacterium]|nr:DUF4198 domain-containing protein [Pseudomonadota bacterium]
MKKIFCITAVIFLFVLVSSVKAHNLWLNPGNNYPEIGTTVDIGIGFGHKYPASRVEQEVKDDRLEEIQVIDPDGNIANLIKVSATLYKLKVEKAGAYLVTAKLKPGYFSMTTEGRKWGDKQSVANCIKCTNYHIEAKTVIIAGGDEKNLSHVAGQTLELIPLNNPEKIKSGDKLNVRVLFDGMPLSNTSVNATYAGFQDEDIAPHKPSTEGNQGSRRHFPVETVTNDKGDAKIQLDKPGYWMVLLSHKPSYPDKEICDEYMYNITFTLQVQ